MPQKILGLDIGESAVNAVLVLRSITGRYRIIASGIINIEDNEGIQDALKKLFQNEIYRDAVCVISLPARALSFRNLQLPFRDKKKIEQTIAYELEPVIQSPIDDIYFDYMRSDRQGGSEVFAATVLKSFLGERLRLLEGYVKVITAIDADAVACALRLPSGDGYKESAILLDIGIKNTVAVFIGKGKILQARYFSFGGALITDKGARFITELKNTLEYLIWQGAMETFPARIWLTGGGALFMGIEESLSEAFSIPVEKFDIAHKELIQMDEAVKKGWQAVVMNQALALATRSAADGAGFNFKRRALEVKWGYEQIKGDLKWMVAVIFIILFLGSVDLYLDYRVSKLKLDNVKSEVIAEYKKYSPETTRIVDPVSQLKVKITEARRITAGISLTQSDIKILDLLKDVSGLAPSSTEFLIRNFNFENGIIVIKGETKNFDSVDAIKKELAKSKYFKSVTIGATNLMKQGDKVEFDLRITTNR